MQDVMLLIVIFLSVILLIVALPKCPPLMGVILACVILLYVIVPLSEKAGNSKVTSKL
jgi:hypothetical protein